MKTHFYISDTSDKTQTARIRMRLRDGRDINLYGVTEEAILPGNWANANHWIKTDPEFPRMRSIISTLNDLKSFVDNKYLDDKKAGEISKAWLKEAIELFYHPENGEDRKPVTLVEFIQDFIDEAPKRKNPKTSKSVCYKQIREYERSFYYLKEFSKKKKKEHDFKDMNLSFYNNWVEFMEEQKLALNTIGKKIAKSIELNSMPNFTY